MKMEFAEGNGYKLPVARYQERMPNGGRYVTAKWLGTNFCPKATDGLNAKFKNAAVGISMNVQNSTDREIARIAKLGPSRNKPKRIVLLKPYLSASLPPIRVAVAPANEIIVVTDPETASD